MTRRTSPLTLILLAFAAGVLAWVAESWLVGSGRALFVAPLTMPITLVLVAIVLLVLAWPIRAYTRDLRRRRDALEGREDASARDADAGTGGDGRAPRGRSSKRVDPLLAVRVLAFAKASSLAAAVIGGAAVAILAFVVTRPVIGEPLLLPAIAGVAGPVVLLVAGLIAESWCVLPPDGREGQRAASAPSRPLLGA